MYLIVATGVIVVVGRLVEYLTITPFLLGGPSRGGFPNKYIYIDPSGQVRRPSGISGRSSFPIVFDRPSH